MSTEFIICLFISLNSFVLLIWYISRYRITQIREEEQKKVEMAKQNAEMERKLLMAQMNPHFIFSSLNSLQGFILKNKAEEAIRFLQNFSRIIRYNLDNAMQEFITLDRELELIRLYLNHRLMRCDYKFDIEFNLPEDINPQSIYIPPLLIQPYVENAFRQALLHTDNGAGFLLLDFSIESGNLKCVIQDKGLGRKNSMGAENLKIPAHELFPAHLLQERIDLLNKTMHSDKYRILTTDLYDGHGAINGARVEINLPIESPAFFLS